MSRRAFDLEGLENRVLLSVGTPVFEPAVAPAAAVFRPMVAGPTLTVADRQELVNNWNGSNAATLQSYLTAGNTTAFDNELLSYMRSRTNAHYFFGESNVAGINAFINGDAGLVAQKNTRIGFANKIVAHLFPATVNSSTYDVQLPTVVDWLNKPATTSQSDFLYTLNQQLYWKDLAMAYRYTGSATYVTELLTQLDSWSRQYTRLANYNDWSKSTVAPKWDLYTCSERVKSWFNAYFMVMGAGGWTAYYNTMFLHRLLLQGQFMGGTTVLYNVTSNKATSHATALYELGMLFPEFKQAAAWQSTGLTRMFGCLDGQFRADGGHYEQSPGYHGGAMAGFFDAYRLAALNNAAWGSKPSRKLRAVIEAFYQLLSPNGNQAALSDTYRSQGVTFFTRAAIIFGDTRWPKSRPRLDDVWQLGTAACTPLLGLQTYATSLPQRGMTAQFANSGYYITRSGDDADARQLTFDAGPTGGLHGHYDLLNFELFGYGKPLIADPGLLSYSSSYATDRAWIISTPAHNTLSLDGLNHAASEKSTVAQRTTWVEAPGQVQMAATHYAYSGFKGSPVVARHIWHDQQNAFLVIDIANATFAHAYTQSFNLASTSYTKFSGGVIRTTTGTGDVLLQPMLLAGQTVGAKNVILSNTTPPAGTATGLRFTISQTSKYAIFGTLIATFDNGAVPTISARWLRYPTAKRAGQIEVTKNGVPTIVWFAFPNLTPVVNAAAATTSARAVSAMPPSAFSSTTIPAAKDDWLATAWE